MGNIKIIADSTCDLSQNLIKQYDITIIPLCIVLDMESYYDLEEIVPEKIYEWSENCHKTPKTSAPSIQKVEDILLPFIKEGKDIIFIGISEEMSTTCNVVHLIKNEYLYERIFVINSMNLSTGIGLQVLRAANMAGEGYRAEEIVAVIEGARSDVRASFVVDTLEYLAMGGRCSSVTALLASKLKLKPMIEVANGKMGVTKKYRGTLERSIMKYVEDMKEDLCKADKSYVFITHSGCTNEIIEEVKNYLAKLNYFENIEITRAGGVVSSHCGPGTLGVLFYEK
ncbi:MAG TPA: DegV family protein [Lachnospiraceae bacterium]|nr:DegV family protein [Lachnospiraceae bacterium]